VNVNAALAGKFDVRNIIDIHDDVGLNPQ